MRRQRAAVSIAFVLLAPSAAHAQSLESAEALQRWVTAVNQHRPGITDAQVRLTATLSYRERKALDPAIQFFVSTLHRDNPAMSSSSGRGKIVDLSRAIRMDPGVGLFIRRAAVLHTDAAIFAERFHVTPDAGPSPPPMPSGRRRTDPVSPLLWSDSVVMHSDGRIIGEMPANWNWPFARSLVGLLLPASGTGLGTADDRAFVGAWYHAVDAYLMATGNLAELAPHLRQAAAVLPDDPHVLFDRACYAETLGLAYNQAVRDEPGLWDARSGAGVRLPSEEATNDDAERLFRRAIDADPGYAEARVRLARLLELRGRHDEAAGAIETALAQASERHVVFYARLVAGRIAQARGRAGEAVDQYAEASTLFPDAQSAMVGASQAAFMNADVTAALTFVQKLGPGSEPFDADPWRIYKLGAGRDADALVGAIWARMKARPAVDRGIVK